MTDLIQADRVTPDIIGRKILVNTRAGASLMGEVHSYQINVEPAWESFVGVGVGPLNTSLHVRLAGFEDSVSVWGDSTVKVLA